MLTVHHIPLCKMGCHMPRRPSKIWTQPDSGLDLLVRFKVSSFRITTLNLFFLGQGDVRIAPFFLNRTSHQDLLPAPKIRGCATKVARLSNWATRTYNHHPVQILSQIWRSNTIMWFDRLWQYTGEGWTVCPVTALEPKGIIAIRGGPVRGTVKKWKVLFTLSF